MRLIETHLGNIFASTPLAILQPRTALAWQVASKTVLRTGFGLFSDILPGSVVDLVGINPPYSKTFQGGLLGTAGGTAIDSAESRSTTVAANQTFTSGFAQGQLIVRLGAFESERRACSRSRSRRFRTETSRALFHAMELRAGAADRYDDESEGAVCRHARGESAIRNTGERVSDRVPGLLRAVSLRPAFRPAIWRGDPT